MEVKTTGFGARVFCGVFVGHRAVSVRVLAGSCISKRRRGCFVIESPKWAWGMRMLQRHGVGSEVVGKNWRGRDWEWVSGTSGYTINSAFAQHADLLRRSTKDIQIRRYVGLKPSLQ